MIKIYFCKSNLTNNNKYLFVNENTKEYSFDYGFHEYDNSVNLGYFIQSDLSSPFKDVCDKYAADYKEINFSVFDIKYL